MKLTKLAIAVAAVTVSMSAQAEVEISGDLNIGYYYNYDKGNNKREFNENYSELNFDAEEEHNGITYMAHFEVDFQGLYDPVKFEEFRVGAKGKFGEVWIGDVQDACEKLQKGGDFGTFLHVDSRGCEAHNSGTILYWKRFKYKQGKQKREIRAGISYNPEKNIQTVGLRYKHKKGMEFAVGYQDIDTDNNADNDNGIYANASATVAFGPLEFKTRIEEIKDSGKSAMWNLKGKYTFGNNAVYAAYEQDRTGEDVMTAGYRREFGENVAFIIEARDDPQNGLDADETKKEYAAGLSIKF